VSIGLWAVFTVVAAFGQTLRNAMQKELTATLGTVGATHVRFLFGLPFALVFLVCVLAATGYSFPAINSRMMAWTILGAGAQIAATAMLLAALKQKSFVVTTALIKIEPVHVALFGLIFLGDALSVPLIVAILIACAGVLIMSWPKDQASAVADGGWQPALLGLAAGAVFGISAIGYRGGILALEHRRLHGRLRLADVVPGLCPRECCESSHAGTRRDLLRPARRAQHVQAGPRLARRARHCPRGHRRHHSAQRLTGVRTRSGSALPHFLPVLPQLVPQTLDNLALVVSVNRGVTIH